MNVELKDVPKVLAQVEAKIKEIEKSPKVKKVVIEDSPFSMGQKISDITDLALLVKMKADIDGREKEFNLAKKSLGEAVKDVKFELCGHSSSKWTAAIKYRIFILSKEDELKKLKDIKSVLEKNMEEEDRKKREISEALKGVEL